MSSTNSVQVTVVGSCGAHKNDSVHYHDLVFPCYGTMRFNLWCPIQTYTSPLCLLFSLQVYIAKVDPTSNLGLSTDSIYSYSIGHIKRVLGGEAPETQPSRCMSRGPSGITVALKGLSRTYCVICISVMSYLTTRSTSSLWPSDVIKCVLPYFFFYCAQFFYLDFFTSIIVGA